MAGAISMAALVLQPALALAEQVERSDTNMRVGATDVSHQVYDLHMFSLWICVAIGVIVFGVMFYSIFAHRKSRGAVAAHFHESTKLEIAWTIVPFVILIFMAVPATKTLTDMYDTRDAALDVQITGYQWKWKYSYPKEGVEYFSSLRTPRDEIDNLAPKGENYLLDVDEPLVIPAGKKVRFLVTAADVIHSWWMPRLCGKERRHSWLHQRGVGQCARARHLPRPVHRALRQGPRLHADRRARAPRGRVQHLACLPQGRSRRGARADGAELHHGPVHGARQRGL
jgi:cytochrome c oxidase subunit 2